MMHLDIRYIGYVTKIDRFDQKLTEMIHFWTDPQTSVFGGMSVRIANTKSPFGAINIVIYFNVFPNLAESIF